MNTEIQIPKKNNHATRYRHGGCGTRLYNIWAAMKRRTTSPKAISYPYYGAKNIKVCDEWKVYENFRDWSLSHGYANGLTIDRIDSNKDYSPDNCRWTTMKEQQNNRRNNHIITFSGETKTLSQWAEIVGINPKTLSRRIVDKGWPIDKALTTPLMKHYQKNEEW